MKKALAVASASALGVAAAAGGAAGAASAETPPPPCATFDDYISSVGGDLTNLFVTCVPQYGLGKVEFTIASDVPFPADFLPLTDDGVTSTSELDMGAATTYFDATPPITSPIQPINDPVTTPTTQTYQAAVIAPITSVTPYSADAVPAAVLASCLPGDPTGVLIYRISFSPVFGTFSQQVAGEDWSYRVGGTPVDTFSFVFPGGDSFCYTDLNGENTYAGPTSGGIPPVPLFTPPFGFAFSDADPFYDLGVFNRLTKPALAATGVDSSTIPATALGAAGATVVGLAALLFSLRRRRRARIQ
jgi:LPXTG-motif cell wall-anchored protein